MRDLSAVRQGWEEVERAEACLSYSGSAQDSFRQWLQLQRVFEPQVRETATLFGPERPSALEVRCRLRLPLGAVGAPVRAYFPQTASKLEAELLIPDHADVANAIGAASGSVVQRVEILVEPEYNVAGIGSYSVHTPEERREFGELEVALSYARSAGHRLALAAARRAGAEEVVVEEERVDQSGSLAEPGNSLYLGSRLCFTAAGRPQMATQEGP